MLCILTYIIMLLYRWLYVLQDRKQDHDIMKEHLLETGILSNLLHVNGLI